ncbi:MAG: sigma-70 family RNA polymerase sigma factor [Deltaproteobacteria bacterium]|nr:sigma-70 family RNA polymerase sigma factor [Deltaproteobacteria bacterium]
MRESLEGVFRREKVRVVGALVRIVGSLDAAEEVFQEAALAALDEWPSRGVPANPGAWLTTTAKNRALDIARHRRVVLEKTPLLVSDSSVEPDTLRTIHDDALRLIFTCCHPLLSLESRVALTLKVVLGMSTDEVARALLSTEKTVGQRLARAKKTLEDSGVPYEVPEQKELPERLDAVLAVVYLVLNEGHTAREGDLVRVELQAEALRLAREVCELMPIEPEPFGLFALVAFSLARAETRTDEAGDLVPLADQDRARWDRRLIKEGLVALSRARRLGGGGSYTLQAEIAACHVTAPDLERTDWARIAAAYDALAAIDHSPVVAMNRAVAVSRVAGAEQGLAVLAPIADALDRYHHFHAVRADLLARAGKSPIASLERALALVTNEHERRWLVGRLVAAREKEAAHM